MWILFISVLLSNINSTTSEDLAKAELTVYVPDLHCNNGSLMLAIYTAQDKFPSDDASVKQRITCEDITDNRIILNLIKGNSYAIAIYHDKNDNLKLDRNFFQYPSEPFGFSNNPGILTGPPSFDDAKFYFDQEKELTIRLK